MSKGLTTRTIVLLILGLIVLGLAVMLIYLGVGPFKHTANYDICKAKLMAYCTGTGTWEADNGCAGVRFKGHKPFCSDEASCYKGQDCKDASDEYINCCNYLG